VVKVLTRSLRPPGDSKANPAPRHPIAPPVKTGVYPDGRVTLPTRRWRLAKDLDR